MGVVPLDKFSLNQFYEKTPTALKYILVISLIIVGSYFLFSRKVSKGQDKELEKIEQTIETTYQLIDRFDNFRTAQYLYNEETLEYLKNIYTLVEELNENTNRKFDMLLKSGGQNTDDIIERLTLLNESFEKLQVAYTPDEFTEFPPIDDPRKKHLFKPTITPLDDEGKPIEEESIDINSGEKFYNMNNQTIQADTSKIKHPNE